MKPIYVDRPVPGDPDGRSSRRARSVRVNLSESPLCWLHAHRKLTDRQFAAGELLRRDFERAGLAARTTMAWDTVPKSRTRRGPPDPAAATHAQLDAHRRFHAAIDKAGPGLADIAWRIACAGESPPAAERAMGWPARSGRLVLSLALDRVADYYRLHEENRRGLA